MIKGRKTKRETIFTALLVGIIIFSGIMACKNADLKKEIVTIKEENSLLQEQLATEEMQKLKESEIAGTLQNDEILTYIEGGMIERICQKYSDADMEVLAICPVGEDGHSNVKRFFVCREGYYTTFYLADLLTGDIYNLNARVPLVDVIERNEKESEDLEEEVIDQNIRIDDFDGDQAVDILFVNPHFETSGRLRNGILIWLQKDGDFLPVNSAFCGNYTGWRDNAFSLQLQDYERKLVEQQSAEEWDIDNISIWVKEEFFAGKEEDLAQILQNPVERVHYTERREAEQVQVTVMEDENSLYHVLIPENSYSEEKINEWLQIFYEEEKKNEEILVEDDHFFDWSIWNVRADDAIISFLADNYTYTGGAHGNSFTWAANFDTRSGRILTMDDVMTDVETFYSFAMEYIENNYEEYGWGQDYVRDALRGDGWCLTGYGIRIFLNGGNGLGLYQYEIPYEEIASYMKEEYLPTSRTAEFDLYMEGRAKMDVNADGILDTVIAPAYNEDGWEVVINGTVTEIFPEWEGISVKEAEYYGTSLRRDDKGITYLHWWAPIYYDEVNSERIIFIYRIEEERVAFEEAHADD